MAIALGRSKETECRESLHKLSKKLSGQMVVLFTNRTKDDVMRLIKFTVTSCKCIAMIASASSVFCCY